MKKQLVAASIAALFSVGVFAQASAPAVAPAAPAATTADAAQLASGTKTKKHHRKHHKNTTKAAPIPSSAPKP
ncbi:hypothetical protein [Caballeronia sp. TF1N1]|uniref:hypothetical protein n=1 Tax=Caballeronia sp. TF1N1 TaxID=2878153 RepID=UPI001FD432E2|nr:hypothetical protein [Caballeronia sp. TF1N1]